MKKKITVDNVYAFIQGNLRYTIWYSPYVFLIRKFIKEQIQSRILSMNEECYNTGSCIMCGCQTTHLQMADKKCEGNCYPTMIKDRKTWKDLKKGYIKYVDGDTWKLVDNKFKLIK